MKKLAVHIGINQCDNSAYGMEIPELFVSENDAIELNNISSNNEFESQLLLSEKATSSAILDAIKSASKELKEGDIFRLFYSGHGCQLPDLNSDEKDGFDEAWVCYDRPLLDDEIKLALSQFSEGVNILIINDSCHSHGSTEGKKHRVKSKKLLHPRNLSQQIITQYLSDKKRLSALKRKALSLSKKSPDLSAGILILSACDEHEVAWESDNGHGLFTEQIIKMINQNQKVKKGEKPKRLTGSFLIKSAKDKLKGIQTPQLSKLGNISRSFLYSSLF